MPTRDSGDQQIRLLGALAGRNDAIHDFRVVAESAAAKDLVAARRKKNLPVRFNYRGRLVELFDLFAARNRTGCAIHYNLNETDGQGRKLGNIKSVRALALDLDRAPLPTRWRIPPHIVVRSSRGKHQCLWLTKKTKDFAKCRNVMLRLANFYGGDPCVADPTRVLRLPGFMHQKQTPFRSTLLKCEAGTRLRLSAFDWLPPLPKPKKGNGESGTVSCELAARYFEHLPANKFGHDKYDDWLRIGMAMHHATGGEARDGWLAWCASDPEFNDDESQAIAEAKWESFGFDRQSAVTVGTLVHFGELFNVPDEIISELKFGKGSAVEDFAEAFVDVCDADDGIVPGSVRDVKSRS
jgi:hypothetical protein